MFVTKVGRDGRLYVRPFLSRLGWEAGYNLKAWEFHGALAIAAARDGPIKYSGGNHIWVGSFLRDVLGVSPGDFVGLDVNNRTLYVRKVTGSSFDGLHEIRVVGKSPKWFMKSFLEAAGIREGDFVDIWVGDGEIHIVKSPV